MYACTHARFLSALAWLSSLHVQNVHGMSMSMTTSDQRPHQQQHHRSTKSTENDIINGFANNLTNCSTTGFTKQLGSKDMHKTRIRGYTVNVQYRFGCR